MGTRQHGMPGFKALDLVGDMELVMRAREEAPGLLPELSSPRFAALAAELAAAKAQAAAAAAANDDEADAGAAANGGAGEGAGADS